MKRNEFLKALLDAAVAGGIERAEAYFAEDETMSIMARGGQIEEYAVNTAGGVSLRGLVNGKMGSAFSEALDEDAIAMLVRGVKESAALIENEDEQFIFAGSEKYETVDCLSKAPSTPEERIAYALDLEQKTIAQNEKVREVGYCGVDVTRRTVEIVNTLGLNLSHTADLAVAFCDAVAREGERSTDGWFSGVGRSLNQLDAEKIAREAAETAAFKLGAKPCASGVMPVIFDWQSMSSMLACFSGVFSADAAQKGLSLLAGKEGEMIFAPCITIVDDPLLEGGPGSKPFDGEGVATYTKEVVAQGKLITLLHNLKTAKKAGVTTTGNAARAGYASGVGVSPSNFLIKPGEMSLEAMCAEMGEGLVVTELEGLHAGANEVSGDFSLSSKGYLVENGKKGRAVEQVTVAGNFFEMLKNAVAVGSDLHIDGAINSPSIRIQSLSVAGK